MACIGPRQKSKRGWRRGWRRRQLGRLYTPTSPFWIRYLMGIPPPVARLGHDCKGDVIISPQKCTAWSICFRSPDNECTLSESVTALKNPSSIAAKTTVSSKPA